LLTSRLNTKGSTFTCSLVEEVSVFDATNAGLESPCMARKVSFVPSTGSVLYAVNEHLARQLGLIMLLSNADHFRICSDFKISL